MANWPGVSQADLPTDCPAVQAAGYSPQGNIQGHIIRLLSIS